MYTPSCEHVNVEIVDTLLSPDSVVDDESVARAELVVQSQLLGHFTCSDQQVSQFQGSSIRPQGLVALSHSELLGDDQQTIYICIYVCDGVSSQYMTMQCNHHVHYALSLSLATHCVGA